MILFPCLRVYSSQGFFGSIKKAQFLFFFTPLCLFHFKLLFMYSKGQCFHSVPLIVDTENSFICTSMLVSMLIHWLVKKICKRRYNNLSFICVCFSDFIC